MKIILLLFTSAICFCAEQIYESGVTVSAFIGSGFSGNIDGVGEETMLSFPEGIRPWKDGSFLVMHAGGRIRSFDAAGTITNLFNLGDYAIDFVTVPESNIVFCATQTAIYRVRPPEGPVLFAGHPVSNGDQDGFRLEARFRQIQSIAIHEGNIFVGQGDAPRVRMVDTNGTVSTYAGSGNRGTTDGKGLFSSFHLLQSLECTPDGTIFLMDINGVRRINPDRTVTTVTLRNEKDGPAGVAGVSDARQFLFTNGLLYISDRSTIRVMHPDGSIRTVAGKFGVQEYANGLGDTARFKVTSGIAAINGNTLLVSDHNDHRIRLVKTGGFRREVQLLAHLFAGVRIEGFPGSHYIIEATSGFEDGEWIEVDRLQLPKSPHVWIDEESDGEVRRFYRAVLIE